MVSICIAMAFLLALLWSVANGQFDDEKGPAQRLLFDQDNTNKKNKTI
jgi:cbb3-type cytochrome oxidase maturation protein